MNDKPTYQELENQIAELQKQNEILHIEHSIKNKHIETQEVKSCEELKSIFEKYQMILESAPDALFISNLKGVTIEANLAAAKMLGLSKDDIIGHNFLDLGLLQMNQIPKALKLMTTGLFSKSQKAEEFNIKRKDGTEIFIELNAHFINYNGEKHMLASARDITKRKAAEEKLIQLNIKLQEIIATKDKLFSIIAHDLRSPFNSILGFSEMLIENIRVDEDKETEEFLRAINYSAKSTLVLLDNLLNWAKSQIGLINDNPERLVLSSIIQETIDHFELNAKSKNLTLNYIHSDEIEVYANENMLKTVLRNLISNSIKFTNLNGRVDVFVLHKTDHIEITISDNGVGMSSRACKKLFNISTNITSVGTANEEGSGLGLVLCKEFVEKLGGKIWVVSKKGKGSDFKFTLPLD